MDSEVDVAVNEEEEKKVQQILLIQSTLREILSDLKDANDSEVTITQHACVSSGQIDVLKDQIVFLAKRILVLHDSQEEMQTQLHWLLELEKPLSRTEARSRTSLAVSSDGSGQETLPVVHKVTTTAPETTADLTDSGCSTNISSQSTASEFHSQQNLAPECGTQEHDGFGDGMSDNLLSLSKICRRDQLYLSSGFLQKLVETEQEYTQQLRLAINTKPADKDTSSDCLECLYARHCVLWQMLMVLLRKHRETGQVTVDAVTLTLIRFWSDQELFDMYHELIISDHRPIQTREQFPANRAPSTQSVSIILRKYAQFLNTYLMGFRDSRFYTDVHLDHVISVLGYLISNQKFNPERACSKTRLFPPDSRLLASGETPQNKFAVSENIYHVEYVEGTCETRKYISSSSVVAELPAVHVDETSKSRKKYSIERRFSSASYPIKTQEDQQHSQLKNQHSVQHEFHSSRSSSPKQSWTNGLIKFLKSSKVKITPNKNERSRFAQL